MEVIFRTDKRESKELLNNMIRACDTGHTRHYRNREEESSASFDEPMGRLPRTCLGCIFHKDQTRKDILCSRARWEMTQRSEGHTACEEQGVRVVAAQCTRG